LRTKEKDRKKYGLSKTPTAVPNRGASIKRGGVNESLSITHVQNKTSNKARNTFSVVKQRNTG